LDIHKKEGGRLDIMKHEGGRLDNRIILGGRLDICRITYRGFIQNYRVISFSSNLAWFPLILLVIIVTLARNIQNFWHLDIVTQHINHNTPQNSDTQLQKAPLLAPSTLLAKQQHP
jgi:hypothetical protein